MAISYSLLPVASDMSVLIAQHHEKKVLTRPLTTTCLEMILPWPLHSQVISLQCNWIDD